MAGFEVTTEEPIAVPQPLIPWNRKIRLCHPNSVTATVASSAVASSSRIIMHPTTICVAEIRNEPNNSFTFIQTHGLDRSILDDSASKPPLLSWKDDQIVTLPGFVVV